MHVIIPCFMTTRDYSIVSHCCVIHVCVYFIVWIEYVIVICFCFTVLFWRCILSCSSFLFFYLFKLFHCPQPKENIKNI